jgi:uncharacterized protein YbaR (Trm112 family)
MTMIDKDLLSILVCPATHQALALADEAQVQAANARIQAGEQNNVAGSAVEESIEGGLLRQDGQILYPIRQGIPVLLAEEGLPQPA